jgi:hypothetical protein
LELLKDNKTDVCFTTETWLKLDDKAKFAEVHEMGFDIHSAPRRGRGGGVAFIFNPNRVKLIRNSVTGFSSFEVLETVVKLGGELYRFCVVYRSTNATSLERYRETRLVLFMEEFGNYLDDLLSKAGKPVISGDFNFHVEQQGNAAAKSFISLYENKGYSQHVQAPTHQCGGTLDLVLTRVNVADRVEISALQVTPNTGIDSDHYFVSFEVPVLVDFQKEQQYETRDIRHLRKIDIDRFRGDLKAALPLTEDLASLTLEESLSTYSEVLADLLETHAPLKSWNFKINKSPWWNNKCEEARRGRRRAERKKKKRKDPESEALYKEKSVDAAIIIGRERDKFYHEKLDVVKGDAKATYKVVNGLLDSQYGSNKLPNGESDLEIANNLLSCFHDKVKGIYSNIENDLLNNPQPAPVATERPSCELSTFFDVSEDSIRHIIKSMATKSCELDPLPMWLFKTCLDEVLPLVTHIANLSLAEGCFPDGLKHALVRPTLKKANLDADNLKNYRPISNLSYISKIIEKCVHEQLTHYLDYNNMFAQFQSGYRKGHSCETAITKIHNDILMQIDSKSHVVLMLLDLSAAFDTINHQTLLQRLKTDYNVDGMVLQWFASYLDKRTFAVKVNKTSSDSIFLSIGVPQGSILGPLLFILYTRDLEKIAAKYGFSIHLYADDTQIYFAFDPTRSFSNHMNRLTACFVEIKHWMSHNFLKLNGDKTEMMVLKNARSPYDRVNTFVLDGVSITASKDAKNLGFYFDTNMSLEKHINNITRICYTNLMNLGRIGSKLSRNLKIQMVHSSIHSFLDSCNSVFGALSDTHVRKLQKIQNAAVRFIFGLYGKDKRKSLTSYFKEIHFLPVRFRIRFKICTTVFKCINNLAPKYMSDMLTIRVPNRHQLRTDNDYFLLATPPKPALARTESAFCLSGPKTWNELPYELRARSEYAAFKIILKTYYFKQAFADSLTEDEKLFL